MEISEVYEPASDANAFDYALLNLRLQLDGTIAIIDLIPGQITDRPPEDHASNTDPVLSKILSQARLIESSPRFMRAHFYNIQAIAIQEEFRDLVEIVTIDLTKLPKLPNGHAYPFLNVVNSLWKRRLPDYQGGDDPAIKHFKIVSMATCIDVLACLEKTEWIDS